MAIVERKRKSGTVFYVSFWWQGKVVWERAGKERREAVRLEKRRLAEVRAGAYAPAESRDATTVLQYATTWLAKRPGRNAKDEERAVTAHVLGREWLASMPLNAVRVPHMLRLVDELKVTLSDRGTVLSSKSVANIYGVMRTMFRDAYARELTPTDPGVLPKGTIKRRGKNAASKRLPYGAADVLRITANEGVRADARLWATLAFYTGMRKGEVCGRRWRDWDRAATPLSSLDVTSQYDDQPLKTEDTKGDQPRRVPVHPTLARALEAWWHDGFETVYLRPPTLADFIVPQHNFEPHTESTAYKMWSGVTCPQSGVTNLSVHSTRHTFISLARRGGARKEVIERITHNAAGDIVDAYTTWDWAPLCEAVRCFLPGTPTVDATVDASSEEASFPVDNGGGVGNRSGDGNATTGNSSVLREIVDGREAPSKTEKNRPRAANSAARQRWGHLPRSVARAHRRPSAEDAILLGRVNAAVAAAYAQDPDAIDRAVRKLARTHTRGAR